VAPLSPSSQVSPSCPAGNLPGDRMIADAPSGGSPGNTEFSPVPSAQARPTSTNVMRRDRPGQRDAPESDEAARASSRSTVALGGVAIQMTVDECIALAEAENES
jgi:hypothetical protein